MKKKKVISFLVAATMFFSAFTTTAYAADLDSPIDEVIIDEYAIFNSLESSFYLSGNNADCLSVAVAGKAASITATQYLEKYSGWFWIWDTVTTWNKTESGQLLTMSNQTSLSSGTYRLRTVFTVTSTSGQTETQTAYSFERTIS